ncbi:hypothetical protein [Bacteroides pyogenes]|uniref:Uncharacterized protein n=2 Tax=Bacteroides pyogenes TaxID=310300 RepID=W4PHQ2_9BACE|nr:hypothetical protein [Bacteroides pyogenes]GAE16170.1 hypothetical protein JCM6292_2562 [Bacteroides pyogenes JCM 6292]GAE18913.1 hypothetical protein JCM6294_1877 [Bacteroides pyogenes DSM 20611 = JCM 6294]
MPGGSVTNVTTARFFGSLPIERGKAMQAAALPYRLDRPSARRMLTGLRALPAVSCRIGWVGGLPAGYSPACVCRSPPATVSVA